MSLQVSEAVIWQETASGVSLYHTETGEFRTLNDTGAKIWVLLSDDGQKESVITKLSLLYGGREGALGQRIRTDVEEFINAMVADGLIDEGAAA